MDKSNSIPKKTRKRSASYPAFNLEEVVEATKELKEKLGDGPYSREHMATALGYKAATGISGVKISSCVHFGLLERTGNTYSQSELAKRLFNYYDENERKNTLLEAFSKPALYSKLMAEYDGKSLPLMLESILVRNYGIQENATKAAAANFRESAEFVGALKNGVLAVGADEGAAQTSAALPTSASLNTGRNLSGGSKAMPDRHAAGSDTNHLSVTLPSGLIVSYSQELASAFAFGAFGQELMALDKAITSYVASQESNTEAETSNSEDIDEG